ncbi:MAG: glycosyltransferase [Methylococcales bacterium]
MAGIVFVVWPLISSINSSLKLARDLRSGGHRVHYLGLVDCEEPVREHGFDFIPVFETWFPKDFTERREQRLQSLNGWQRFLEIRRFTRQDQAFLDALVEGKERQLDDIVAQLWPNLMILVLSDDAMIIPALLAHSAGIKAVYLCDTLGRGENSAVPPVTTGIIPTRDWFGKIKIRLAWKKLFLVRNCQALVAAWLGLAVSWHRAMRLLARRYHCPWELVEQTDEFPLQFKLPELVLFPRPFEFPDADQSDRQYIEASIDLKRQQAPFSWDRLDAGCPLIYCALGTVDWLSKEKYRNFFQTVIDVAALRMDFQWVIALGEAFDPADFNSIPAKVTIINRAPQLDLLNRAAIMISHGGAATVKECIYFGVPMVLFPLGFDHPGYAARVRYHGLGVTGDIHRLNVRTLNHLIDTVAGDPRYRAQVQQMQCKFREAENSRPGLRIIETMIGGSTPIRERAANSAR